MSSRFDPHAASSAGVESLVQPVEIRRALAKLVAGSLDVPAHLMQRAENSGFPGIVAVRDGEPQRLDLDHRAHPRNIQQVLAADVGYPKAALADPDDQPLEISRDRPSRSGVAPMS